MLGEKRLHALRNLPGYLHSGGDGKRLHALLGSYPFVEEKVRSLAPSELIADYEYLPSDSPLRDVQAAIRMAAYVLDRDPDQLSSQLLARLLDRSDQREIEEFLTSARRLPARSGGLVPVMASLTQPGRALLQTFAAPPGLGGSMTAVELVPDGERVVSASSDRTLRVWNLTTGREVRVLRGHERSLTALQLISNGKRAVSGSLDQTVRVWNLETGALEEKISVGGMVQAVAVTPSGEQIIAGLDDGSITILERSTQTVRRLTGHQKSIRSLAIASDGRRLASTSEDGTLRIWNLATGEIERVAHWDVAVRYAIATPDGEKIIVSFRDDAIGIFSLAEGRLIARLEGTRGSGGRLALSRDGRTLVSASLDNLAICDLAAMRVKATLPLPQRAGSVALTPDGRRAITGDFSNKLHLWDLAVETAEWPERSLDPVTSLAWVPGEDLLLSAAKNRTLTVWDVRSGRALRTLTGHTGSVQTVAALPDGRRAISGSFDNTLRIWDLETGENLRTLTGHKGGILELALIGDGSSVISADLWGEIKIFSLDEGREIRSFQQPSGYLTTLAATTDGCLAVVGIRDEGNDEPVILDLATGRVLGDLRGHEGPVVKALIVAEGHRIVTGSDDATIRIWDLASRRELRRLEGHADLVGSLAATPDGRFLASGSADSTVRVWALDTGECLAVFTGEESISACAISSDARLVVAGESLGNLHFLRLESAGSVHVERASITASKPPPPAGAARPPCRIDGT